MSDKEPIISWEQADQVMQDQRAEIARLRLTEEEQAKLTEIGRECYRQCCQTDDEESSLRWLHNSFFLVKLLERLA